jgi:tRNA nucleotidyltransferase (CCA-adding enzyme)
MEIFLVGGAVRDKLLKHEAVTIEKDWLVVGSSPEKMQEQGYIPVGKDFPVFLHPETKEEYALARTERKTAKGYKGFSFYTDKSITVEEDLLRRDLTINAIAEDSDGKLIDPFKGQQDIKHKVLRHVSPAFKEDPLRVLRLARFAAQFKHLGFSVAEETMELVKEISASGELEALVPERIWRELHKALESQHPETFFEVLREGEALKVIFPEIDALFGIEQVAKYHPEIDTGIHLMMCLQQAVRLKANTRTRYAVLGHDLGKATTPKEELPKHIGHEARSKKLVSAFSKKNKAPKDYQQLAEKVAEHHLLCHTAFELKAKTLLKLFNKLSAFNRPEGFEEFLIACEADARGRTGLEDRDYPNVKYLRLMLKAAKTITSDEIDSTKFEGKAFGEQLDLLRIKAIETAKSNYQHQP